MPNPNLTLYRRAYEILGVDINELFEDRAMYTGVVIKDAMQKLMHISLQKAVKEFKANGWSVDDYVSPDFDENEDVVVKVEGVDE